MTGKHFWALLVATAGLCSAVVSTGSAATAESPPASLSFRAVIPGMSSDGASEQPTGPAVTLGHFSQHLEGGLVVAGEIINGTSSPITGVRAELVITTPGGMVRRAIESLVRTVAPGGTAPFQVTVPGMTSPAEQFDGRVTSFEIAAEAPARATFVFAGPYPFQIGPPDPKTGVTPYSTHLEQFRGKLTNASGMGLTMLEVVVALYDSAGNVLSVTTASTVSVPFQGALPNAVLAPGSTGDFTFGLPTGFILRTPGSVTIRGFLNSREVESPSER